MSYEDLLSAFSESDYNINKGLSGEEKEYCQDEKQAQNIMTGRLEKLDKMLFYFFIWETPKDNPKEIIATSYTPQFKIRHEHFDITDGGTLIPASNKTFYPTLESLIKQLTSHGYRGLTRTGYSITSPSVVSRELEVVPGGNVGAVAAAKASGEIQPPPKKQTCCVIL